MLLLLKTNSDYDNDSVDDDDDNDDVFRSYVDVPFFAEALARYDRQHKMVLEIIEKRPLGLLLVDATKLKQSLIPNPLGCLNV